jgi:hypothetical protein
MHMDLISTRLASCEGSLFLEALCGDLLLFRIGFGGIGGAYPLVIALSEEGWGERPRLESLISYHF